LFFSKKECFILILLIGYGRIEEENTKRGIDL